MFEIKSKSGKNVVVVVVGVVCCGSYITFDILYIQSISKCLFSPKFMLEKAIENIIILYGKDLMKGVWNLSLLWFDGLLHIQYN